jgi:prepilin-type N-terminal cleavage/methylation domain-containing protein
MPGKFIITFRNSGFTLVELLLVIMILGIMSTLSISVVRQVYHTSRVEKTRMTIRKIDRVIMEMYANFENRRVETNLGMISGLTDSHKAKVTQAAILWCKRDMIRMEMPSNWDEIKPSSYGSGDQCYMFYRFQIDGSVVAWANSNASPLQKLYYETYKNACDHYGEAKVKRFGSAKCLYLIVMYGNPESRELFFDHEIQTDEDGLSYFVDGWGNPIYFLRWAPGLVLSDRQPDMDDTGAQQAMPDPLDPTEVGGRIVEINRWDTNARCGIDLQGGTNDPPFHGWALLPVIMSSGGVTDGYDPENDSDIKKDFDDGFWYNFGIQMYPTDAGKNIHLPVVDPFYFPLGKPLSSGANHNIIHNHTVLR